MLIDSRERREGETERGRETSISCLSHMPQPGLNSQPRQVPKPGTKLMMLWLTGWCSNQLDHTSQGLWWEILRSILFATSQYKIANHIANCSHHVIHNIPRTYCYCNCKYVPFEHLHPFPPLPPHLWQSPVVLCFSEFGFLQVWCFRFHMWDHTVFAPLYLSYFT